MNESSYIEQYKRMMRYYERFKKINDGKVHNENSENSRDDVYSFFIHGYHLKDWIKNDPESGIDSSTVESFVHGDLNLKICGDISNGAKHLILDRPKIGEGAEMQGSHLSVYLGGQEPIIRVKYNIEADGRFYNAFDVATEAVNLWKEFLARHARDFNTLI